MAALDNNRVAWTYTDDQAVDYRISAKAVYVAQGGGTVPQGGAAAAASVRRIPKEIKPRRVKMVDVATGNKVRFEVAYAVDAPIWTTPGTTMDLNINGAAVSCQATATHRGEKSRDTTTQST
jgi:hypothetical protein